PELKRRGFRREMLVFFILLILGVGTACAKVLNVPIPNPGDWVAALLQPLSNIFKTFMP
ncbi:MAG: hypothetical protein K0R47_5638, partial [Brevibacillus sp.]|nr:hypothetical protein [Brevibacillus sp.]